MLKFGAQLLSELEFTDHHEEAIGIEHAGAQQGGETLTAHSVLTEAGEVGGFKTITSLMVLSEPVLHDAVTNRRGLDSHANDEECTNKKPLRQEGR